MTSPNSIRVAVWAVIVRDDKLLLVECYDPNSVLPHHYNLPGGGVEPGESLHEAVIREVREETTTSVTVSELLFIYEYVPRLEDNRYDKRPVVRPVFRCVLPPNSEPRLPDTPDEFQIGVQWIPLDELHAIPLIPQIAAFLRDAIRHPNPRDPFIPAGSEHGISKA